MRYRPDSEKLQGWLQRTAAGVQKARSVAIATALRTRVTTKDLVDFAATIRAADPKVLVAPDIIYVADNVINGGGERGREYAELQAGLEASGVQDHELARDNAGHNHFIPQLAPKVRSAPACTPVLPHNPSLFTRMQILESYTHFHSNALMRLVPQHFEVLRLPPIYTAPSLLRQFDPGKVLRLPLQLLL